MSQRRVNDLGRDPVGPLLLRLALPTVTAQMVNALYNIVDRIYIGHLKPDGSLALTGLGVSYPVLMLITALSALVCVGGSARAAISMGEGRDDRANEILGNCTALLVVVSVAVTVFFQVFKRPLLLLFGATENTLGYASDYLTIYLLGTIFVQISVGLNYFISTQGFTTVSMRTVLIGAVINIVLDPVFIFGLDMGVRGAALATIIAQAVSALWVLRFLMGRRTRLRLRRGNFHIRWPVLAPVLAIGVSPFVMQATESALNVAFNSSLRAYGGDLAVGAMTISSSVMQVIYTVFTGFTQGAQPIISYNYGAGNAERCRKTFKLLFAILVGVSTVIWALVQLFPGVFVALFNDNPELVTYAQWALKIYTAALFVVGVQNACQQTFVALGQAKVSLFLALLRKVILLIPLIFILPQFLADKVFAVFLAEPVADVLAALTTASIFFFRFPRILAAREAELAQRRQAD